MFFDCLKKYRVSIFSIYIFSFISVFYSKKDNITVKIFFEGL